MNVQGCHYILAICLTYRVEDHDGFRPGAPSHFFFLFLLVFKVKIPDCFLLIENLSTLPERPFGGGFYTSLNKSMNFDPIVTIQNINNIFDVIPFRQKIF